MNRSVSPLRRIRPQFDRIRHRVSGVARSMRGKRDERDASMNDTDLNATGAASVAQSVSDAEDRSAGAPAELGGQG